jgi:hypothetical protein
LAASLLDVTGGVAKNELIGFGGSVTMTVGGGGDFLSLAWGPPRSEELAEGALVGADPKLKVDGAGVTEGAPNENGSGAGIAGPLRFPSPELACPAVAPKVDEAVETLVGGSSGGLIDISGPAGTACGKAVDS